MDNNKNDNDTTATASSTAMRDVKRQRGIDGKINQTKRDRNTINNGNKETNTKSSAKDGIELGVEAIHNFMNEDNNDENIVTKNEK